MGPQGPAGAGGAGFDFITGSGLPGPALPTAGDYYIDVNAVIDTTTPDAVDTGNCEVAYGPTVNQAVATMLADSYEVASTEPDTVLSISGILPLTSADVPATLRLFCQDGDGSQVVPTDAQWWASPVG